MVPSPNSVPVIQITPGPSPALTYRPLLRPSSALVVRFTGRSDPAASRWPRSISVRAVVSAPRPGGGPHADAGAHAAAAPHIVTLNRVVTMNVDRRSTCTPPGNPSAQWHRE